MNNIAMFLAIDKKNNNHILMNTIDAAARKYGYPETQDAVTQLSAFGNYPLELAKNSHIKKDSMSSVLKWSPKYKNDGELKRLNAIKYIANVLYSCDVKENCDYWRYIADVSLENCVKD